jgi:hypothetical protein
MHKQLLIESYRQQNQLVQWHVADFSDADMLVRPVEHANHAAWHIGHLATTYPNVLNLIAPNTIPPLPQEFCDLHTKKGSTLNDGFESKAQLLARLDQMTEAAIAWVEKLTDADLSKPAPPQLKGWVSTLGQLAYALPPHTNMHIGQIQVIRRKLGKPVLF